jgi:NADH-quinone oxidoreductase subunit E
MQFFYEIELIEELHNLQDTYGYIPEEDIIRVAKKHEIPKAHLYGIISFYSMFYLKPTGKYIIRICDSVSCRIKDSKNILKTIKNYLKIDEGETTEDKKFTLEVVECLGHCGEGPVMSINGHYYKYLTKDKVLEILKSLN